MRTFSHDKNLTKLGTLVKGFGAAGEKIIVFFHKFSGDSRIAATDVMIVDNFSGDSRIAATNMGGAGWIEGSFKGEDAFFLCAHFPMIKV